MATIEPKDTSTAATGDDYDSPWKVMLDACFEAFMAFYFPEIHADIDRDRGHELLDTELQRIVRDAEIGHTPRLIQSISHASSAPVTRAVCMELHSLAGGKQTGLLNGDTAVG